MGSQAVEVPGLTAPEAEDEQASEARHSSPEVPGSRQLDARLFLVVTSILVVLTALFIGGVWIQSRGYQAGIDAALSSGVKDHAAILSYNRAQGAAIVKTSALFLGYLLVFTGALYVLRAATVAYGLTAKSKETEGTLQTSSPGLVIITLGVVLIAITILTRSDINYEAPSPAPAAEAQGTIHAEDSIDASSSAPTTIPPSQRKH